MLKIARERRVCVSIRQHKLEFDPKGTGPSDPPHRGSKMFAELTAGERDDRTAG
jgi:hypothetical protein